MERKEGAEEVLDPWKHRLAGGGQDPAGAQDPAGGQDLLHASLRVQVSGVIRIPQP